ncbi:MAG: DUF4166 domain-containing protein [Acidimicrobiia bacterium]|nr:DUF4166 domain-containing protein [Acidimicrobiia bacterium]
MTAPGATRPPPPGIDSVVGALLGHRLDALAPVVRAMHAVPHDTRCDGMVDVRQARARRGRLAARLMHLPRPVGDTHITLSVERSAGAEQQRPLERWRRTFGGDPMVSDQTTDGVCLIERYGLLELGFELRVADGRLFFHHVRTHVRLGSRRLPMARWLAPTVAASVGAIPPVDRIDISVRIAAPLLGELFSYAGALTPIDVP